MVDGKKLLVLGGAVSSLDVVEQAKKMGVYTIVADDRQTGVAKEAADEAVVVSTTDMEGLLTLIREKNIDGVFTGPSEFNIVNAMRLCELADLPFYATKKQWDICSNKASFKELCRKYDVPVVPEYELDKKFLPEELEKIDFPVIVKPVDGCSSKGIAVCNNKDELKAAYDYALSFSKEGKVIVERYIRNGGVGTSVRYIVDDGDFYLSLLGDRYVVDPEENNILINVLTVYPSKYTSMYIDKIDSNTVKMFKGIGYNNGVFFMQALPEGEHIYFHEMGLRLSGGLTYKITEAANKVNDLAMMIRYALGGKMCTEEEAQRIAPYLNGKIAASLCIPLKAGTIGKISGLDEVLGMIDEDGLTQYYFEGDTIAPEAIGTLLQHFARFKFFAENQKELIDKINKIQDTLKIFDTKGKDMLFMRFDTDRLK